MITRSTCPAASCLMACLEALYPRAGAPGGEGEAIGVLFDWRQLEPAVAEEVWKGIEAEPPAVQRQIVRRCRLPALVGDSAEAKRRLSQAQALCAVVGAPVAREQLHWIEGLLVQRRGDPEAAEKLFRAARAGFLRLEEPDHAAVLALDLALLYEGRGRSAEALVMAAEALPLFESLKVHREALVALDVLRGCLAAHSLSPEACGSCAAAWRGSASGHGSRRLTFLGRRLSPDRPGASAGFITCLGRDASAVGGRKPPSRLVAPRRSYRQARGIQVAFGLRRRVPPHPWDDSRGFPLDRGPYGGWQSIYPSRRRSCIDYGSMKGRKTTVRVGRAAQLPRCRFIGRWDASRGSSGTTGMGRDSFGRRGTGFVI